MPLLESGLPPNALAGISQVVDFDLYPPCSLHPSDEASSSLQQSVEWGFLSDFPTWKLLPVTKQERGEAAGRLA